MDLYFIECFMFTKNKNIEVKRKIDKKINFYSLCISRCFKKFTTIDEKEISNSNQLAI